MGSWNGTCGLTNMPIRAGDEVVVVAMVQNNEIDSMCYTTPLYGPILMPFYGKYNDYGAAEECHGFGLNYVVNLIKSNLVEVEQGPNSYHDIPVTKDTFNEKVFWDAIHENRLAVSHFRGKCNVAMTLIHKSVVDSLMENYEFSRYVKVNGKYETITYKFAEVLAGIPAIIEAAKKPRNFDNVMEIFKNPVANLFDSKFDEEEQDTNLAVVWLSRDLDYRYPLMKFDITVSGLIKAKEFDVLEQFLTEHTKAKFIDAFMDSTRKIWTPQGGSGSQSGGLKPYRLLIEAQETVFARRKKEREEWCDEDNEYKEDYN